MTSENITGKEQISFIEAPTEVTAGKPFEVKVSAEKIADKIGEKHVNIELYLDERLMDKKDLELSEGMAETILTVVGTEDMISAREIMNCNIHGFGVCGACGTRSAIVNLKLVINCGNKDSWEDSMGIEIVSAITKPGNKKCKWGPEL